MQQDSQNEEWQQPPQQDPGVAYAPLTDNSAQDTSDSGVEPQPAATENNDVADDEAVLRWDGPEYIVHDRDRLWYIVFGVVTALLMAVSILLIKSITFTILIPVMAAALFVYIRREPQHITYTMSRKGIYVNDKLYGYDMFKAFSVQSAGGTHSVVLLPRKRFQMALTAYFPEEVGEPLVDMLAARLPMQTYSPDVLDKLLARLRI